MFVIGALDVADGCETMRCDFYAICDGDVLTGARCVCPSSCVQVLELIYCICLTYCTHSNNNHTNSNS